MGGIGEMNDSVDKVVVIRALIAQFGEDTPIRKIAQYAEDEYLIPFNQAARLIYELV
jgi:hypothetical protein